MSRRLAAQRGSALLAVALALSCTSERFTDPIRSNGAATRSLTPAQGCQSRCLFVADTRPFRAAIVPSDSANATVDLGGFSVRGAPGDEVRLLVDMAGASVPGEWADRDVIVVANGQETRYALKDLTSAVQVYRFAEAGTVSLHYGLARGGPSGMPHDAVRIEQVVTGSAVVFAARAPWVRPSAGANLSLLSTASQTCQAPAPGTYCGVVVGFNPYVVGSPFGEFQNPAGTGQSLPITITFDKPVFSVAVSIADPDFDGNIMVVHTTAGTSTTYSFVGDNTPGTYTEYSIGTSEVGVVSIDLIPASGDYVAYFGLTFSTDFVCPPSADNFTLPGDPLPHHPLDSPEVRQGFRDAMTAANPNATPGTGQRKETGGFVWERTDGTTFTQIVPDLNATECTYSPGVPGPAPEPGAHVIAKFHTHPATTGEPVYGCPGFAQTPGDGLPVPKAAPNKNGGGSGNPLDLTKGDWGSTNDGFPTYAYTKDGRAYRLDPNTSPSQWSKNRNKWDMTDTNGCANKLPQ